MLPLIINIVSVYVNSNRSFGININAIVIIICGLNLLGLVPGSVAYLGNLIGIGGIFVWVSIASSLMVNNFGNFISDLVPNAPLGLVPLLYVVESISLMVRPIAMFLRIIINLGCGHLLLIICGIIGIWGNMIGLSLILVLEFGVAVVQSFVYGIMLIL